MLTKKEANELKNHLSVVNYEYDTHRQYVMTFVFNYIDEITESMPNKIKEYLNRYFKLGGKITINEIARLGVNDGEWATNPQLELKVNELVVVVNRLLEKLEMLHVD